MAFDKQHKAIDLRRHLSDFARAEIASPLKALQKYLGKPDSIILAFGQFYHRSLTLRISKARLFPGMPSAAYFPFSSISGEALVPDYFPLTAPRPPPSFAWLWNLFGARSPIKEKTSTITVPKYPVDPGDLSLSTALQYGPALGLVQLQKVIHDFTANVYQPAYEDFTTLVHTGNTEGYAL